MEPRQAIRTPFLPGGKDNLTVTIGVELGADPDAERALTRPISAKRVNIPLALIPDRWISGIFWLWSHSGTVAQRAVKPAFRGPTPDPGT